MDHFAGVWRHLIIHCLAWAILLGCAGLACAQPADDAAGTGGRLLATAGVIQIEGAGGGGLVPWATIAGYGTRDQWGGTAHDTYVQTGAFGIDSAGAAVGAYDQLELSYAHVWLFTGQAGARLGIGRDAQLQMDVAGAKLRLFGDLVYDQDTLLPQVAIGTQAKWADAHAVIRAVGGRAPATADVYLAATKLFLAQSLLLDVTLRATQANQFGLLGAAGNGGSIRLEPEASAAWLPMRRLVIGVEYRGKPDDLRFAREDAAFDVFAALFIDKSVSATLAYANLGHVARQGVQDGVYFSVAVGF